VPLSVLACEPPPTVPSGAAPEPKIAAVYRSRCGACHVRVEPGTHTREQLEAALGRHRRRVRLREDQWSELVSYLAIPDPPPAPVPPAAPVPCLPSPQPPALPNPDEKSSP
jgi:hypothetical protein